MEKYYIIIFEPEFEYHEFIRYIDFIEYVSRFQDKLEKCIFKIIKGEEI